MRHYIALIHKDPDSDFGVSFPDVPGCITAGSTLDEARSMAGEALTMHLGGMREDGEEWPASSSLDAIMAERENQDAVAFLVPVEEAAPKVARINITLPQDVLDAADSYAARIGFTRSNLIKTALLRLVRQHDKEVLAELGRKAETARPTARRQQVKGAR